MTQQSGPTIRFGTSWSTQFRFTQAIGRGLSELKRVDATVHVLRPGGVSALADNTIDVVFSKWVVNEHRYSGKGIYAEREAGRLAAHHRLAPAGGPLPLRDGPVDGHRVVRAAHRGEASAAHGRKRCRGRPPGVRLQLCRHREVGRLRESHGPHGPRRQGTLRRRTARRLLGRRQRLRLLGLAVGRLTRLPLPRHQRRGHTAARGQGPAPPGDPRGFRPRRRPHPHRARRLPHRPLLPRRPRRRIGLPLGEGDRRQQTGHRTSRRSRSTTTTARPEASP